MQQVVGGEIVAAMLAAEGVDKVFGIVDGTYMGLYASFEKYGIELVSPRHETSAAHMAGAYARLTGKLGVCMASNGPGVANMLPGVAVENGEGNRVLLVTSCRRQGIAYPDRGGTYQYFDQAGATRPMTKWSGACPDVDRIPELMRRALRISWRGRPGVVHVDIPENVLNGTYDVAGGYDREPHTYRRTEPIAPPLEQVRAAAEILRQAELPMLHVGSGVVHAGAYTEMMAVAERLQAPITSSWGARSLLVDDEPLALPTSAMEAAMQARSESDALLVVGSRLGETDWWGRGRHWGGATGAKVIQVDNDEEILGLNRPAELTVLADARTFLQALADALDEKAVPEARLATRRDKVKALGEEQKKVEEELGMALLGEEAPMHPAHVPHVCGQVFDDDAVAVIDGGNTAVWSTFFHRVKRPNRILSTFKFGMLGAGPGQTLGAKVADPDRQVYCITGDGAMGMHLQEVETAVRHRLPVVWLVLCDRQWGMVKLTQQFGLPDMRKVLGVESEQTINADFEEIAFDEAARAMGAHGERVSAPGELEPALKRGLASGKPVVVHVDVDPAKHLLPPGILEFKEMHQEPQG